MDYKKYGIGERDIKFRAWNLETKQLKEQLPNDHMTPVILPFIHDNMDISCSLGNCLRFPGSYVVMQYTGLKDKNGKEIYEGDIVKCFPSSETRIVIFKNGTFYVRRFKTNGVLTDILIPLYGYINSPHKEPTEVIGSIFENPELLKK